MRSVQTSTIKSLWCL